MARTPLSLPFAGSLLREWREKRGLNQGELARRCTEQGTPVSRFQVVRAENEISKPQPDTLVAFAQALGIEVDDLLEKPKSQARRRAS